MSCRRCRPCSWCSSSPRCSTASPRVPASAPARTSTTCCRGPSCSPPCSEPDSPPRTSCRTPSAAISTGSGCSRRPASRCSAAGRRSKPSRVLPAALVVTAACVALGAPIDGGIAGLAVCLLLVALLSAAFSGVFHVAGLATRDPQTALALQPLGVLVGLVSTALVPASVAASGFVRRRTPEPRERRRRRRSGLAGRRCPVERGRVRAGDLRRRDRAHAACRRPPTGSSVTCASS